MEIGAELEKTRKLNGASQSGILGLPDISMGGTACNNEQAAACESGERGEQQHRIPQVDALRWKPAPQSTDRAQVHEYSTAQGAIVLKKHQRAALGGGEGCRIWTNEARCSKEQRGGACMPMYTRVNRPERRRNE